MIQPPEFAQCRALIVEDNPLNRQLVEALLGAMGIGTIGMAVDGADGLERLGQLVPDIIILDIMMPRMDGFEFLSRLRADPDHGDVPVLVTTALSEKAERARAFDLGASDYVVKPIDQREFIARVSVHLRNRMQLARLRRYQERLRADLAAAAAMQDGLLPAPNRVKAIESAYGVRIASLFRSSSELGGDLWDVVAIDPDRFGLYLVDFSGHGIAAAINTFRLHVLMAKLADQAIDPAALLERVNQALLSVLQRGQFATMIYVVFDVARNKAVFASAGGTAPVHRAADGTAGLLVSHSHPLGLVPESRFRTIEVPFGPGSALLVYSDGLSEASDGQDGMLGEEGVRRIAETCSGDLDGEVKTLADRGFGFHDDLSVVWVSR
ncbi:PP2C family protein-serine/threonine phosphatase [Magnetospirillum sp. SS-4]|uniref:PP2C family protein-serine/threonine phosphatase n=1 Tax=Magnetospirillum sp. SS-4 TaxID=2681465 RepID=UPI00137F3999|nr:fused response regulator/phosphatase [Magnetospirillum sp. SS-4]CAA7616743.1 Serine phosphatase RsbU [Magnetospirillum sp. SS-4]